MAFLLMLKVVMRLLPEFFVDDRDEFIQGILPSVAPRQKQSRYFLRAGFPHPYPRNARMMQIRIKLSLPLSAKKDHVLLICGRLPEFEYIANARVLYDVFYSSGAFPYQSPGFSPYQLPGDASHPVTLPFSSNLASPGAPAFYGVLGNLMAGGGLPFNRPEIVTV